MATDTATTTQPSSTPAKPAAAAKPRPRKRATTARKRAATSRKTAATRKPAARAAAPRAQAKALNGGQQFVAGVIDAQEKTVTAIVDYQTRAAELSQIPGATAVATAQAQLLRGATDVYVSAARAFLK